jgi:hypothetical protein
MGMPSVLFKILSILVAITPALLAYISCLQQYSTGYKLLFCVIILSVVYAILQYLIHTAKKFSYSKIKPSKVTPVNREMMLFLMSSLLPVLTFSLRDNNLGLVVFSCFIIFSILFLTDSYYCSPLFALLRYKMYQMEINGVAFLLITKKNIQTLDDCNINVVKLTSHIRLEV